MDHQAVHVHCREMIGCAYTKKKYNALWLSYFGAGRQFKL